VCSATYYPVVEWPAHPLTDVRETGILESFPVGWDAMQFDRLKRREFITLFAVLPLLGRL
jgi:hypothetical protein